MKKLSVAALLIVAVLAILTACTQKPEVVWEVTYMAQGRLDDGFSDVVQTEDGGYLVCGYDGENGLYAKYNENGIEEWMKKIENAWFDTIIQTREGYFLAGDIGTDDGVDAYALMIDGEGEPLFEVILSGSGEESFLCALEKEDGTLLLGGWTTSVDGDFEGQSMGGKDAFIAEVNQSGTTIKTTRYSGSQDESVVQLMGDGNGYTAALLGNSDDGIFAGKRKSLGTDLDEDVFLMKLDDKKEIEWMTAIGGSGIDMSFGLAETDEGYILAGGTTSQDGDFAGAATKKEASSSFICNLNKQGEIQSISMIPDGTLYSFTPDEKGAYMLTGYRQKGERYVGWLANVNSEGKILWQREYGEDGNGYFYGGVMARDGSFVAVGAFGTKENGEIDMNATAVKFAA